MALTFKQALDKVSPKEEDLKKLEEIIDKQILDHMKAAGRRGFGAVSIDSHIFPDYRTMHAIMERYKGAGWNVSYELDKGDTEYLLISKKDRR